MTHNWRDEIPFEAGSVKVERRFLAEVCFAQAPATRRFSASIPFGELSGNDVLAIGCGTGVHARPLVAAGAARLVPFSAQYALPRHFGWFLCATARCRA